MSGRWAQAIFILLGLAGVLAAPPLRAQGASEDLRFEPVKIDGQWYRFDRVSGELLSISSPGSKGGDASKKESFKEAPPEPDSKRHETKLAKNRLPVVLLPDDPPDYQPEIETAAHYVPHEITAAHRRRAAKDLAEYVNQLGVAAPLQVSADNVTGTINVENKGLRKLLALELTIFMPVDKGTPLEHHILMVDREGCPLPPTPPQGPGRKGRPTNLKIDFRTPVLVQGKLDVQVTYLKFEE